MKNIKNVAIALLPFVVLILFIVLTNPYELPLILIPVPFMLIWFGVFRLGALVLRALRVSAGRSRVIASLAASIVLLGALLQSIGQLQLKDALLLFVLLVGMAFYLQRINA